MTGCAASLRVYEPLAAFPVPERSAWAAYVAAGRAPDRVGGVAREREAVLRALVAVPAALPDDPGEAFVVEVDGVTLVCPWRTRLRAAEALGSWRTGLPEEVADAFVPRAVAEAAADELLDRRRSEPDLRVHVRTSTWSVPLPWFVLVDGGERRLELGEASVRTSRELVYRTAMSRARRRVARALDVLRRTVDDDAGVAGVEELGRWLEEFHPRSLVELDYGGLVHLVGDDALLRDESARDVAEALAALSDGAAERAGEAYERVTGRMKALLAVESAN